MELEEIVRRVFGRSSIENFDNKNAGLKSKVYGDADARTFHSLSRAEAYIDAALGELSESGSRDDDRPGRLGPRLVRFDMTVHHGPSVVSPDRLSVSCWNDFSTIRANAALYSGKWMYEVQLGSNGLMQIGWSTARCKFLQEFGVGDTAMSYAYDGNRVRKWNVTTHEYGEPWFTYDVIGCALDMDEAKMSFYRNGRDLGVAFDKVTTGPGIAYFPTVSLAIAENLIANFGSTPLKYPVDGYQAPQAAPTEELNKATLLLHWLTNLVTVMKSEDETREESNAIGKKDTRTLSIDTYYMCLGRLIIKHLGPLLTMPYITEALFLPFVQRFDFIENGASKLSICLDLMWMFMEEHEMKACLENSMVSLRLSYGNISIMPSNTEPCDNLAPLINLCRHTRTRQYLLQSVFFDRLRIAKFFHVKPLDDPGLRDIVDKIWWETDPIDESLEVSRKSYMDSCAKIKSAILELECRQVELLTLLLDNNDGNSRTPSSRTIFLRQFRRFLHENLLINRMPLPLTVSCLHRLLGAFKVLWPDSGAPTFVPCRFFYDATINYSKIDRLGGVLSHLTKTYRSDLMHHLGPEHEVVIGPEPSRESTSTFAGGTVRMNEIARFARFVAMNASRRALPMVFETFGVTQYAHDTTPLRLGPADEELSLLELLDGIVLFYHTAAKKQIAKIAGLRDSMTEYVKALTETKSRLELIKRSKDPDAASIQKELTRTIGVFNTKLAEQSRHMAWVRAAIYSEEKQQQIAWLLRVVTLTLRKASQEGNMFSFVPDFYLEALAELCVDLRSHFHPTAPIERIPDYETVLLEVGQFLCDHFLDSRIVHANARDTIILTLASFVSNSLTLRSLEQVPKESRLNFVANLLTPYENRAWAQSNWVLVRFWQGDGFAFRYEKSPHLEKKIGPKMLQQDSITQPIKPCPSTIYQHHVKQVLLSNLPATTKFLNSLLNQLNWAFSEFIGMVQEIHNVSSRPERVFIESRQLKICATCFDLAVFLLRVLEMIATIAPSIFNDPAQFSSESLLIRLCQLLCQILNRVSSQTSSFQHVVLLDIPDLETLDHFPILAAVMGILLALLQEEMSADTGADVKEAPRTTRTLLMEPSFQISSLYFVLGEGTLKKTALKNVKPFTLLNYKEDVSEQEIARVRAMIKHLDKNRGLLPDTRLSSDDDNTCTICYAYPIAVTFKPCSHQSCRNCIDRHVLNSRECFFCKAIITEIRDLEGTLLHDLTSNSA